MLLEPEPTNEFAPWAVAVRSQRQKKLGYVPRQYSGIVASLIGGGGIWSLERCGGCSCRALPLGDQRG